MKYSQLRKWNVYNFPVEMSFSPLEKQPTAIEFFKAVLVNKFPTRHSQNSDEAYRIIKNFYEY